MHSVVHKSSGSEGPGRGRPPTFDRGTVIREAVTLFWHDGFQHTSLKDIEQRLGIGRSTLYNSFGGKDGLYRSAVKSYLDGTNETIFSVALQGTEGLEDLVALLKRQQAALTNPSNPRGCLIVNAITTSDHPEAAERYLRLLGEAIAAALNRAAAMGEIRPAEESKLTSALSTSMVGANITAKSGGTAVELDEVFAGLIHNVRSWSNTNEQAQ